MKKVMLVAATAMLVAGFSTSAMAGAFCASCHEGGKAKVGPALKDVVKAYGSVDKVFEFLNSDKALEPKVADFASKKGIMESQLKKYRGLDDAKKAEVRAWFEGQVK